ncbi:MAG: hypothetical protein HY096_00135 [Nitrospinae bacterium]|nr:hypothetical protein [Nitrospinota bacterium]
MKRRKGTKIASQSVSLNTPNNFLVPICFHLAIRFLNYLKHFNTFSVVLSERPP